MGCYLAIFTQNEKTGKGSHIFVIVIGELPSGDLLEKWKKREFVIGEWGVLSIIKSGEYWVSLNFEKVLIHSVCL